jgi:predicted Zn-dependent peptidase
VHDYLADAVFGDHPLGRRVLGEAEVIASIPIPEISAYHQARYTSDNIIVAAAGNIEHERIAELAERFIKPTETPSQNGANGSLPSPEPRLKFQAKETEQYHICFGAQGITRSDERRFQLAVMDSIFGGSTSSRLFREVREKRGLAYAVGSYSEQYTDSGMVATYVGTREENVEEACNIIGTEIERLRSEPVSDEELARAKESVKGRLVLSSESTAARMTRIARSTLFDLPILSLDEMLEEVDSVSVADLEDLAGELFSRGRMSAAGIGRDEECFRGALSPVEEALAA